MRSFWVRAWLSCVFLASRPSLLFHIFSYTGMVLKGKDSGAQLDFCHALCALGLS